MFGARRRHLAEVAEDLAGLATKYAAVRKQLADKTAESETWRAQAGAADRMATDLIARTRELKEARAELQKTENQLGAVRRQVAVRIGRQVEYSNAAVDNMRRLARAIHACARYRAELAQQRADLAQQKRVVDRQAEQLFDAIGYQPDQRALLDQEVTPA